jgi:membrane protease YdiL (CAAX protease family)
VTSDSPLVTQQIVPQTKPPVAAAWHTAVLILVVGAWASWGYLGTHTSQYQQNPHRLFTYILTAGWEWLVVAYIAWGVRSHGLRFRELLGNRWKSFTDFLKDFGIAAAFWIFALVVLGVVNFAFLHLKPQPSVKLMLPQTILESVVWVFVCVTAGFCEETIFRGYLQRQFIAWTGNISAGVVLSALLFGAAHIYGGFKSAILITVFGLLFGILAEFRGSLLPGMMTHAWQDTLAGLASKYVKM